MTSATIYPLKIKSSNWNGVTVYRTYILVNGHWARFGRSETTSYEAEAAFVRRVVSANTAYSFAE